MSRKQTITKFFELTLGASLKNPRWSWGAINPSTNDIFLRVWDDQRSTINGRDCVLLMGSNWNGTGVSERLEHIRALREGARTYAIRCTAQNTQDGIRSISSFETKTLAKLGSVVEKGESVYAEIDEYIATEELVQLSTGAAGAKWTHTEIEACVDAYLEMLIAESNGESYTKSAYNERLRHGQLSARTRASIEYRMQDISAVLVDLGLNRIRGYLPAQNIGADFRSEIVALLDLRGHIDATNYEDTADDELLQRRAMSLRSKGFESPPGGNPQPCTTTSSGAAYLRSPAVRAWVLQVSDGVCELCHNNAPFMDSYGQPFLEVHHVVPLGDGGPDTPENAVALCPNCHRRCHHANDSLQAREMLYTRVHRLVR
tara:strand:- start:13021 stop:14139 length:1119 start_codon:yes stop_codon:yes gene_type:complete